MPASGELTYEGLKDSIVKVPAFVLDFMHEADLVRLSGEDNYFACDCGHDCCPCNSQCK